MVVGGVLFFFMGFGVVLALRLFCGWVLVFGGLPSNPSTTLPLQLCPHGAPGGGGATRMPAQRLRKKRRQIGIEREDDGLHACHDTPNPTWVPWHGRAARVLPGA